MKNNKLLLVGVLLSLTLFFTSAILLFNMYKSHTAKPVFLNQLPQPEKNMAVSTKTLEEKVTLGAIGDILIHDTVYVNARTNNGYDFRPMFQVMKSTLQKPDILLANQETILGGVKLGISSYPCFNSPQEVGNALIDSGVDIVSTANNHSLDKGEKGLTASIRYMDKIHLPHVGTYENSEDHQTLKILSKNGIKIAYLSYTYGTNGIPVPKGKDYLVNLIDKKAMKEEIKRARKRADVVVLSIHWGNEYQRFPTNDQKQLAKFVVNQGVDIVFGHHPHVLQPMEWLQSKDGRRALVVYSLGNFLSAQVRDYKDIGGMASIEVTKVVVEDKTKISLSKPNFNPTYVSHVNNSYRVVPLKEAGNYGLPEASQRYAEIMNHMTSAMK
ncbi:CapA family protein [Bacillus massilinigeriensis]|uniref:CapA family protein n=1 Tax=Bacillus massilionigeriensis TaxID=1805475 RepID=UPI00096B5AC0|nr:CapA family protein [Bacillus massilionigeriensis]